MAIVAAGLIGVATRFGRSAATPAPGFVLRDQQGRVTSLAQFRGKVVLLTFIDPECTEICPLTTQSMAEALKLLGPAAASNVELLGININTAKGTVADVAGYTRTHELPEQWRFLTGSSAQLEPVWHSYHVYVATKGDDILHDTAVFVIDRNGNERNVHSTDMSYQAVGDEARTLAQDVAKLLPGSLGILASSQDAQAQQKPLQPDETFRLRAVGSKPEPVVLGAVHPHLVVFFAGWLAHGTELSDHLSTLDSYAVVAQRRAWPSPVAVDELTTEPSVTGARRTLVPLATTLHTPIVEDANGRLADGYHVGDLPWFVLNSASGKVLWTHTGWLSAAALERQLSSVLSRSDKSSTL